VRAALLGRVLGVAKLDMLGKVGIAGPITIALIRSLVSCSARAPGVPLIVERLFVERLYDVYQHPPTLSRHDRTDV
jgi:hypothetical protein